MSAAPKAVVVSSDARTRSEWLLMTLLPFLLGWKRSMLNHHVIAVVRRPTLLAQVAPFTEIALAACVLYVVLLPAARSRRVSLRALSIVLCNLVAVLFLADVRTRVLLLQPLTWRTLSHLPGLTLLVGSLPTFLGARFWIYGLASLVLLNASMFALPIVARLLDRLGGASTEPPSSAKTRHFVNVALVPLIPVFAAVSIASPPLTYRIESSIFTAPFLAAFHANGQKLERGAAAQCDEKSKPAGPASQASALSGVAPRKNVLLFIGETWAYSEAGLGDGAKTSMPSLRKLAAIGPIATRARTQVAYSTRAIYGILTGRYASPSEELVEGTTPSFGALASILHDTGYSTSFFSTQNLDWDNTREQYRSMGFDVVKDARALVKSAKERGKEPYNDSLGADDELLLDGLLSSVPTDRPFFSVFYNWATHSPYACLRSGGASAKTRSTKEEAGNIDTFRCALHESDAVLGQIVQQLEARGQLENTIIVVVGDHGENFRDGHTAGRACSMTESELNVPLVIAVPGLGAPHVDVAGARQIDIVPTVVDLLGLTSSAPVQGRSLLRGGGSEPSYFNSFGECSVAGLVENGEKYTQNLETGDVTSDDLGADPLGESPTPIDPAIRTQVLGRLAACGQYDDAQARGEAVPRQ